MTRWARKAGILALLLIPRGGWGVEIFFTPGADCENQIVAALKGATTEVVAAVYSINNGRIVAALKAAKARGVRVRVLTDRTQAAGPSSKVIDLVDAGVPLRVHSKHKIEHNKFVVVDSKVAINGSFNWTEPASKVNSENCAVMPEPNAVASYQGRFEQLWRLNSQSRSVASIGKIREKRDR